MKHIAVSLSDMPTLNDVNPFLKLTVVKTPINCHTVRSDILIELVGDGLSVD